MVIHKWVMKKNGTRGTHNKIELEADIRNKLTMPLTVLNRFMTGKKVSQKNVEIAIRELEEILKMMKGI